MFYLVPPHYSTMKKSTIIILIVIGGALGLIISILPSEVSQEKSIRIQAPVATVYFEINALLDTLKWSGEKGKNPQWIESKVENQLIKCGLNDQGFQKTSFLEFKLILEGDQVNVISTYRMNVSELDDRVTWMLLNGKIETMQQAMLVAIKNQSEHRAKVTEQLLRTDSTRTQ